MAMNISPATKLKLAGKTAKARMEVLGPLYWRRYQKAIPAAAGTALAISGLVYAWKRMH